MGFFGNTEGAYDDNVDEVEILESEGDTVAEVLSGQKEDKNTPIPPKEATEETDASAKEKLNDLAEKEAEKKEDAEPVKVPAKTEKKNPSSNGMLVIPAGMVIAGDVKVSGGNVTIEGNVEGTLDADGGSVVVAGSRVTTDITGGSIVVEDGAKLIAKTVTADDVVIRGALKASVSAKKVTLTDHAVVSGNISCENVDIADTAKLKGSVSIKTANEEDIDSIFD